MNFENFLIIAKGENITFNVSSYFFNDTHCEITFKNGKKYTYNKSNVRIIHYKNAFDPKLYLIKHNDRELFDISSIKEFLYDDLKIWRIKYSNGKINDYE
ncbi:MAG: hypothetical protein IKY00_07265, partial [Clostridia bacterium]|nr:hypothetical protein [Clostridia bacterium]